MTFNKFINVVHDLAITIALILGVVVISTGELIGAVIFLLAMIEDNVYKRR